MRRLLIVEFPALSTLAFMASLGVTRGSDLREILYGGISLYGAMLLLGINVYYVGIVICHLLGIRGEDES